MLIVLTSALLTVLVGRTGKTKASKYLAGYFLFVILFNIGQLITYSLAEPAGAIGWYLAALAPFGLSLLV